MRKVRSRSSSAARARSTTSGATPSTSRSTTTSWRTLRALHRGGYRIGLISNTHRCLTTFQRHFALDPFVSAAVSSYEHGRLKPDPSIFRAALDRVGVAPGDGVMVGDSVEHDVDGARQVGMGAVLLVRSGDPPAEPGAGVPVVRTLAELPALLAGLTRTDRALDVIATVPTPAPEAVQAESACHGVCPVIRWT